MKNKSQKVNPNIPVSESVMGKAMDRMPIRGLGDKWARGLSEKAMLKYSKREGMQDVVSTVMAKSVLKDKDGNEITPMDMKNEVPYLITRNDKNIGWVMRKGMAGVGRIYNEHIDSYEALKNDPDRPHVLQNVEFEGIDPEEFGLTDEDFADECVIPSEDETERETGFPGDTYEDDKTHEHTDGIDPTE